MKRLAVNPNRMELLKLRRRLELARRGHKLLKDKFEGLRDRFINQIQLARKKRLQVEKLWLEVYQRGLLLRAELSPDFGRQIFPPNLVCLALDWQKTNILGIGLVNFSLKQRPQPAEHSFWELPALWDELAQKRQRLLLELLQLANIEKVLWVLAAEIERTRRRVNALEYVLLPSLEETVKFITLKLDQMERFNIVSLMKMKEMVASSKEKQ